MLIIVASLLPQLLAAAASEPRPSGATVVPINLGLAVNTVYAFEVEGPLALFFAETHPTALVYDLERAGIVDSGFFPSNPLAPRLAGRLVVAGVYESLAGDLDGDGDLLDTVASAFDVRSGRKAHYGALPTYWILAKPAQLVCSSAGALAIETSEANDGGIDRNGDGDAQDWVIETVLLGRRNGLGGLGGRAPSVLPRSPRSARLPSTGCCLAGTRQGKSLFRIDDERLFVGVDELTLGAGTDLNGDGDGVDRRVLHVWPTDGSAPRNLGVAVRPTLELADHHALFLVDEREQGSDLNGDGDELDVVFEFWDPRTEQVVETGLVVSAIRVVGGHWLLSVYERAVGEDLNGDGDMADTIAHLYEPVIRTSTNLGLAVQEAVGSADELLFTLVEVSSGIDLNGDGDKSDVVLSRYEVASGTATNLATALDSSGPFRDSDRLIGLIVDERSQRADFNLDGDALDRVLGVYDRANGTFRNTGLALGSTRVVGSGPLLFFTVDEAGQGGADLNGDGDADDVLIHCYDAESRTASSLGLQASVFEADASEELVFFLVSEAEQGVDLDGDGQLLSRVAHVVDPRPWTAAGPNRAR